MKEIIIAGFGGQGVLSVGVILANAGLKEGLNITWLPSYGAEQRGGTANCFVKISGEEIASPYIDEADVLVAFNEPSLKKFVDKVKPGGYLFINSSLVKSAVDRDDIHVFSAPVTDAAAELGTAKAANVVMLGLLLAQTKLLSTEAAHQSLEEYFQPAGEKMIEFNKKALAAGGKMSAGG